MSIRILLADDHQIMRDGLRAILASEENFEIVGEAENGREATALARTLVRRTGSCSRCDLDQKT